MATVDIEEKTEDKLLAEINKLRWQLKEANEILNAIRCGDVDALLSSENTGNQVYILQGADHVYREIVEEMQEGFISLSKDGAILFCNSNFVQMLATSLEQVNGRSIYELFFSPSEAETFERALTSSVSFKLEVRLKSTAGYPVAVLVSAKGFNDEQQFAYMIVTDLTEQKRAEQDFMFQVFDQARDAIIVCDLSGRIIRVNKVATKLFGSDVLHGVFDQNIQLYREKDGSPFLIRDSMSGNISGLETKYTNCDDEILTLLINAGLLSGKMPGEELGFLVTIADVSSRRQAEKELAAFNQAIEETLKAKSRFLANMSHEFRTPLNSIIGFSEILQDKIFGPLNEKQADFMANILSSGRNLLNLVSDILDISKMEASKINLDLSCLNLEELCQRTIALFSEKAKKNQVVLSCSIDPGMDGVSVIADVQKIKQILYNLVDNGIKFNRSDGAVSILIQKVCDNFKSATLRIVVEDTGIGIAEEDQAKLFLPFSQLAQSYYDKKTEGTGMGLALTKHLVELYGGEIFLESEIGRGSRFIVLIPIRGENA